MKNIKYVFICLLPLLFACDAKDGTNEVLKWVSKNDLSSYQIYAGSPLGAVMVENAMKNDSIKNVNVRLYFKEDYRHTLYSFLSVAFGSDHLTYTDSVFGKKILSTYQFRNDSLLIKLSSGKQLFVAMGNEESLYRIESILRYPNDSNKYTIYRDNKELDIDKAFQLAGYANAEAMTNPLDTVMWCNVKYVFKK